MKIAIHHRPNSFSERWLEYCHKNDIDYKLVDAFDNDIIQQVRDCKAFILHHHGKFKDVLTAKRVLFALEQAGVKVFSDFNTGWHFDDKVVQKYLLEAIDAPLIPSYVFYDREKALAWAKETTYPKVFKLKGGTAARNVKLISTYRDAKTPNHQAFGKGFHQFNKTGNLNKERFNKFKNGQNNMLEVMKGVGRLVITPEFSKLQVKEVGYVYFQDFIPNNDSNIRVVVIGKSYASAERRLVRKGDFRAPGSGEFNYKNTDKTIIQRAFEIATKLDLQSFDFVLDEKNNPLIIEISHGFGTKGVSSAPGYWDKELIWHRKPFNSQNWIIESLISKSIRQR